MHNSEMGPYSGATSTSKNTDGCANIISHMTTTTATFIKYFILQLRGMCLSTEQRHIKFQQKKCSTNHSKQITIKQHRKIRTLTPISNQCQKQNSNMLLPNSTWKKLFTLFVISWTAQLAAALNGSTRNGGGRGVNGIHSSHNSIPRGGPYKDDAQSAASVSNIVNGHYKTVNEDDDVTSSVSIMADRYCYQHLNICKP